MNERGNHTNNEYNKIIYYYYIKNVLTKKIDMDIPLDDNNDVGNNHWRINDSELLSDLFNKGPTINSGELAYTFDVENQYCGTL